MERLYDAKYLWLFEDKGWPIGAVLMCPKCGYYTKIRTLKELVGGHYLSPHCPSCGAKMVKDGEKE